MTGELGLSSATRSVLARAYIDERPALEAMTGLSTVIVGGALNV